MDDFIGFVLGNLTAGLCRGSLCSVLRYTTDHISHMPFQSLLRLRLLSLLVSFNLSSINYRAFFLMCMRSGSGPQDKFNLKGHCFIIYIFPCANYIRRCFVIYCNIYSNIRSKPRSVTGNVIFYHSLFYRT